VREVQERGTEPTLSTAAVRRRWAFVVPTAAVVVAVDHLTKWWALQALDDRTIDLVWTLRLRLVFNQGAAFGLGSRFAPLLALAALLVVGLLLRTDRLLATRPAAVGVALMIGGAVGNLLDRVFRSGGGFLGGAVVDFFDLQWWPVFNVADVAIVVGAVLLAFGVDHEAGARDDDGADRRADGVEER
jgi:signal peptidase II